MNRHLVGLLLLVCVVLAGGACRPQRVDRTARVQPSVTFKPQEMADALHAVIAADREAYGRQVLPLLQRHKLLSAVGQESSSAAAPLPAHLLRLASESIQRKGAEFHYVLRSLWPINPKNAPETAIEKTGLQFVLEHADQNYYAEESLGGRRYFTAVYPDRAIVDACASCHNQQPGSMKKDFKAGDVMGGLVVRVPLEF